MSDIQTNIAGKAPLTTLGEVILRPRADQTLRRRPCAGRLQLPDPQGEHVAIMGDNGAGKSTFVRQITAVEKRTGGRSGSTADMSTSTPARGPPRPGSRPCSRTLALADHLDVPTTCSSGAKSASISAVLDPRLPGDARGDAGRLRKTGVRSPNISNTIQHMSGGQRQCVAIARTATFPSKLTIMDEADGGARGAGDRAGREHHPPLKEQGQTLILISHNMRPGDGSLRPHRRLAARAHLRQPPQGETDRQDVVATSPAPRPGNSTPARRGDAR